MLAQRSLLEQIEFYFSTLNFSSDAFLQTKSDSEGYVPLDVISKFKLVSQHNKTLPELVDMLKTSKYLELSNDNKSVRRVVRESIADVKERCVKVTWVPCSLSLEEVSRWLNTFGKVEEMKMHFINGTLTFKGTVEVLFSDEEDVQKLFRQDKVYIKGKEVIVKKWECGATWVKVVNGEDRVHFLSGYVDPQGGVVYEILSGLKQKFYSIKGISYDQITSTQYANVLHQRKRMVVAGDSFHPLRSD
ncbi:lupus la ribonucleoprotein, putative [Entamoeba invadens IP1]|uniref:lupus la ribonucleoprotein, putative n=1 Tax=Entamoeba invadens IP1 TaxID=370355 RepID=UPI0002C3F1BE|nr:lupus la ribonucleoprotein, putative [Entamoeba invadens IP1]ELP85105.1 lupus la ribonucleoprotein, putative [Entamoeba invadens IP1]|eukprot:XP_004184451.1 lupus la ribonucleoprotein, putative [Entamoeba invadens IP1]